MIKFIRENIVDLEISSVGLVSVETLNHIEMQENILIRFLQIVIALVTINKLLRKKNNGTGII